MNKRKVLVLGHNGLLGSMIMRSFKDDKLTVVNTRVTKKNCDDFITQALKSKPDIIINAIGKTEKSFERDKMMFVNGEFPQRFVSKMSKDQIFVHPSTDCVFSGNKGNYSLEDTPDAIDTYGESKLASEAIKDSSNALVIRTSIIGPESKIPPRGLMSWFLSQTTDVNGFTNCFWSGVTTDTWCSIVDELLKRDARGLIHITTSEKISKFDLLSLIKQVFQFSINIRPVEYERTIDRSLCDSFIEVPTISTQLKQLKLVMEK